MTKEEELFNNITMEEAEIVDDNEGDNMDNTSRTEGIDDNGTSSVRVIFKTRQYADKFVNRVEEEELAVLNNMAKSDEGNVMVTVDLINTDMPKVEMIYKLYNKKDSSYYVQEVVNNKVSGTISTASERVIKPVTKIAARTTGSLFKGFAKIAISTAFTVIDESAITFKAIKKDVSSSDELFDLKNTMKQGKEKKGVMEVL